MRYPGGNAIGNGVASTMVALFGNSAGAIPATSEFVVAGKLTSAYRALFVAVVGSDPLFMKTRATEAVLVPIALNRIRSTRLPYVACAVKHSTTVPVPSFAVFAVVSVVPH